MYDEPSLPYRCPICMQPVSPCTEDATTGKRTCGCLTCSCPAPIFTQKDGESIYMASIYWNNWVIQYRKEHPNWHKDSLCKDCIRQKEKCDYYDDDGGWRDDFGRLFGVIAWCEPKFEE